MTSPLTSARIDPRALNTILEAYGAATDSEPCGLLLGHVTQGIVRISEAVTTDNDHPGPESAFRIPGAALASIQRDARGSGLEIVGQWHGHLRGGPDPGRADREGLESSEVVDERPRAMLIVGRGVGTSPVLRGYVRRNDEVKEIPVGRT